jgi:hypothetical protein
MGSWIKQGYSLSQATLSLKSIVVDIVVFKIVIPDRLLGQI